MISFAVTPEQSILLTMAANGGATLRIGLPNQDESKKQVVIDGYKHLLPTQDQIRKIFADKWDKDDESGGSKVEVVKVKVPSEPLASGTQLTQEVLDKKFKTVDYPKDFLHDTAAADEKDLLDKYATADLVPNLLVPKPHLSKTEPRKPEDNKLPQKADQPLVLAAPKAGFNDEAASPKGDADTTANDPTPKEYVYVELVTPQGKRYQKFEVTPKGNKYVGDITSEEYQQIQDGKGGKPTK
jgi:hypothetical protein